MRAGGCGEIRGVWLVAAFCLALGCSSEEAPPVTPAGSGGAAGSGGGASSGNGGDTGSSHPVVVDGGTGAAGSAECSITTFLLNSRPAMGDAAADACDFPLTAAPPDPTNVLVRIGAPSATSTTVPPDPNNGWSYGPGNQSIVLNGMYCQQAFNGLFGLITVSYGCGKAPIP